MTYNHIDLFSGIGGWGFAAKMVFGEDYHNLAFVEIDPFGQHIIRKNFGQETQVFGDVHQFDARPYRGRVDILTASWPCQSFSVAGNRKGKDDDRYLWPQALRVLRETRPRWFIGENVGGFISLGLDQTISDLEAEGYSTETFLLPAVGVNAPHQRNRVWIVAHANSNEYRQTESRGLGEENGVSSLNRSEDSTTRELSRTIEQSRNVADSKGMQGNGSNDNSRNSMGQEAIPELGDGSRSTDVADSDSKREGTGSQSGQGSEFIEGSQTLSDSNDSRVPSSKQSGDGDREKGNERRKRFTQPELGRYSFTIPNAHRSPDETERRKREAIQEDGVSRTDDGRGSTNSVEREVGVCVTGESPDVSNADSKGLQGTVFGREPSVEATELASRRIEEGTDTELSIDEFREWRNRWWSDECRLGIHPDGISDRMDCAGWECGVPRVTQEEKEAYYEERLKALGNSIVPQIPMTLFWFIKRIDQEMGI